MFGAMTNGQPGHPDRVLVGAEDGTHYDAICTYISWRECVMVLASVLAACDWWDGILFLDIAAVDVLSSLPYSACHGSW